VKFRILPILNAIGCLVLTGLVAGQWLRERESNQSLAATQGELIAAKEFSSSETKRATALERDIAVLKESIEATQKSAEEAARAAATKATEASTLEAEIAATREQIKTWEAAIAQRDTTLRNLDAELTATRKRLDAAIAQLKVAGAR
jgi:chromosome segregation ATPase